MEPKFLTLLAANELEQWIGQLESLLESCTICPKNCGNDRLKDEIAACYSGRLPIVSSYTAHFGEEPCLSGTGGAGNIFFGNCNLRCVYCQNYQISRRAFAQNRDLADGTILRDEHGRDRSSLYPTLEANYGRRMVPGNFFARRTGHGMKALCRNTNRHRIITGLILMMQKSLKDIRDFQ